jgi:membrane-associated phospholipid phosphatase
MWHLAVPPLALPWVMALTVLAPPCVAQDTHRRAGDTLRWVLPLSAAAYAGLGRHDSEGLLQFGASYAVTLGGTEMLKRTTHVERPDRSNDEAFPSGHAAHAFAAATFVHRRYGIGTAWPWYAGAVYVGWTRVHAGRHRSGDVAGAAALSATSSWWLVRPLGDRPGTTVYPAFGPGSAYVVVHHAW